MQIGTASKRAAAGAARQNAKTLADELMIAVSRPRRILASTLVCLEVALFVGVALTIKALLVTAFAPAQLSPTTRELIPYYFAAPAVIAVVYGPIRTFLPNATGAGVAGFLLAVGAVTYWLWPRSVATWIDLGPYIVLVGGGGAFLAVMLFRDNHPFDRHESWLQERGLGR